MKLKLLLLALFIVPNLCAQLSITGLVTDSLNNPVPFASVYLSNTTIGTSADNMGAYKLTVLQEGLYELTITCIGYKTYSKTIHTEGKNLNINVKLQTNAQTLNEITVTAKDGDRKKNYARFIKVFLGETKNSRSCKILNPEDLRLHYDNTKKMLHGYSVKPIIIENRALGYTITYDLKSFEHYPNKQTSRFHGSPFFQLINGSLTETEAWSRNRLITYYGSQMHFMRTLYADNLQNEKFQLFESYYDAAIKANINDKPLLVNDLRSAKSSDFIIIYSLKPIAVTYDNPELVSDLGHSQSYSYSSIITFANSVKVYENGYFEDGYSITWEGKMSKERMADMLPYDFQPDLWGLSSIQVPPEKKPTLHDTLKNSYLPAEKVYLHTDRSYFVSGDNIWFKAYLTDAVTNKLINNSNTLYVELISPDSKIIDRRIIRLDMGLGNGDFRLKDSIPSGNYNLRAYTNYMRNFGDIFVYNKNIVIDNYMGIKEMNPISAKIDSTGLDIQFFPEGGQLLEDVPAIVGFKAVNSAGIGINIKGSVISSKGDTVATFASTNYGMGSFSFRFKKQLKYVAEGLTDSGIPFKVTLPEPVSRGYALTVTDSTDKLFRVTIQTNQETRDENPFKKLIVQCSSHNSTFLTASIIIDSTWAVILLPKKDFPEGIVCITLKDISGIAYSERLFYIRKKNNIQISIKQEKKVYAAREKVNLKISVRDTSNNPVETRLSIAVTDGNQLKGYETKQDIASYLLLESEIKGNIEQPCSYFDNCNKNRYQAMDNLLLTQGWRSYIWNQVNDTNINTRYYSENGLSISGRLRNTVINRPIANADISMAIFDSVKPIYRFTKTDSTGKYYFDALNFDGIKTSVISASYKNKSDIGMISVDSFIYSSPALPYRRISIPDFENNVSEASSNEVGIKQNYLKTYRIADTVMLKEVTVKAMQPIITKDDTHFRIYGDPDKSFTISPKVASDYRTILEYLKGRVTMPFAASYVEEQKPEPLYLVNDVPVNLETMAAIPFFTVDKIEILKSPTKLAIYGSRGAYGVIIILLKKGSESSGYLTPVLSSINYNIAGYYQARSFYAPRYDVPSSEKYKPDFRTTIFWEPNLVTDSEGNATCTFFNADNKSTIKVDAEGIASEGTPIVGKASFEVR